LPLVREANVKSEAAASLSRMYASWTKSKVIGGMLVVARRDSRTSFDPIEEPFDLVADRSGHQPPMAPAQSIENDPRADRALGGGLACEGLQNAQR